MKPTFLSSSCVNHFNHFPIFFCSLPYSSEAHICWLQTIEIWIKGVNFYVIKSVNLQKTKPKPDFFVINQNALSLCFHQYWLTNLKNVKKNFPLLSKQYILYTKTESGMISKRYVSNLPKKNNELRRLWKKSENFIFALNDI